MILLLALATPLRVQIDRGRVDLPGRKLELRMNHPAGKVEVKITGAQGGPPLLERTEDFTGRGPDEPLVVTWPDPHGEVARIDLRVYDAAGYWVGQALIPWSVSIPHEEVNFATDSAAVAEGETSKLEGSYRLITEALARHHDLGPIKLFIAGHTDTVGQSGYNLQLSQRRARAIAGWFRKRGLRVPIFYEGFGESALRVATADETDEPRNRRVDYILAVEEPALRSAAFRPSWKRAE
jgi:outer membrane protein OmpA-like peptidoglycan-associated protein